VNKENGELSATQPYYDLPYGQIVKGSWGDFKTYQRDSDGAEFLHPKFFGPSIRIASEPGWYIKNRMGIYGKADWNPGPLRRMWGAIKHFTCILNN